LAWALDYEQAVSVAAEAGTAIAEAEGPDAAARYLSEATYACATAGSNPHAWDLARLGLAHTGDRRDVTWARLVSFDAERRAAEDPQYPGIPHDTPERRESARILRAARLDPFGPAPMEAVFSTRAEAEESSNHALRFIWLGDQSGVAAMEREVQAALSHNRFARAGQCANRLACYYLPLGRLDDARRALDQTRAMTARLGRPLFQGAETEDLLAGVLDEGWERVRDIFWPLADSPPPPTAWALGYIRAVSARVAAHLGDRNAALRFLDLLVPWLERGPAWAMYFPAIASHAAETLWLLESVDHVEVVERALQEKVVRPDFRSLAADGRLALARLSALGGRYDEAVSWFAQARSVLSEMGALPLLAIVDYDEALMYVRRGQPGDLERAGPPLDAARRQFEEIGMTGWIRRAEELNRHLG
jgi:tetratricopeptide (TPR) repeat protein